MERQVKTSILILLTFLTGQIFAQPFGTSEHPIGKTTTNYDLLKFWDNNTEEELALYAYAHSFFMGEEKLNFFNLSEEDSFQRLSKEANRELMDGPLLGDVSSEGIKIWVRTLKPASVVVEIIDGKKVKRFGPVESTSLSDLSAVVKVSGLKADRKYKYSIIIDENPIHISRNTSFKTPPNQKRSKKELSRIIFGSCFHRWGLGNEDLMAQMMERGPDAALFIGDISVQDKENNIALHRDDYFFRSFNPAWNELIATTPVYATWDDHDYFSNDKAGIPEGYTYEDKKNVWEVFKNSWNNPYYGLGENGEGVFTHSTIGAFDIIMTDNRYFRTNEAGSFLGKEQMRWLKEALLKCKSDFIIVSCGTMWSDILSKKDSWGINDPEGREEIFKFIEDNNIGATLFISGDRHGARGFTIPRQNGFSFYEFEVAALGSRSGPKVTSEEWTTQLFGIEKRFAFGEFTYIPDKKDPATEFRLIDDFGEIIYQVTIKKSQLMPAKYTLK